MYFGSVALFFYMVACLIKNGFFCCQMESGQGDLGTLANVVTSLANLGDTLKENLNNGDTSDSQQEGQSASEITRSDCSTQSSHKHELLLMLSGVLYLLYTLNLG